MATLVSCLPSRTRLVPLTSPTPGIIWAPASRPRYASSAFRLCFTRSWSPPCKPCRTSLFHLCSPMEHLCPLDPYLFDSLNSVTPATPACTLPFVHLVSSSKLYMHPQPLLRAAHCCLDLKHSIILTFVALPASPLYLLSSPLLVSSCSFPEPEVWEAGPVLSR